MAATIFDSVGFTVSIPAPQTAQASKSNMMDELQAKTKLDQEVMKTKKELWDLHRRSDRINKCGLPL